MPRLNAEAFFVMGFNDEILSDVLNYFTNAEEIGAEELTLWPRGDSSNPQAFWGVWDEAALIGTNEVPGDGVSLDKSTKFAERRSITVECSAEHPDVLAAKVNGTAVHEAAWFTTIQDPKKSDKVVRHKTNEIFTVKRVVGGDDGMISVRLVAAGNIWRRQGGLAG